MRLFFFKQKTAYEMRISDCSSDVCSSDLIFISGGRGRTEELDRQPHAVARGGCWVQQPERASLATREKGTSRDHSDRPHQLTAGDDGWLAFEDAEDFGSSPTATLDSDDPSQI